MLSQQNIKLVTPSPHLNSSYDLGDSILKAEYCELHSKITPEIIHIEKKVAQVFECLAQAEGEIVTREELFAQVWPQMIVSDDSLNRCISVLRKIFKIFQHGLAIITHPKVGFHLVYPNHSPITPQVLSSEHLVTVDSLPTVDIKLTKPNKYLRVAFFIFLTSLIYWLLPTMKTASKIPSSIQSFDEHRVIIMPFKIGDDLIEKYPNLENKFRQLISNHPNLSSIDKAELVSLNTLSTTAIGQRFNARFVIKASIYQENSRDILAWRILNAQTADELSNNQINLVLKQLESNVRELATDFVSTSAQFRFANNKEMYLDYVLKSANYLFSPNSNLAYQRPIINMLASTLTKVDPNSVPMLILLAKLLSDTQWSNHERSFPYIDLAIKTLNKALKLAPQVSGSYQTLADVYQLKYQWLQAHSVLSKGQQLTGLQTNKKAVSFVNLQRITGTLTQQTLMEKQQQHLNDPTNIELGIQLVLLLIEQQQFEKALSLADSLPISLRAWGKHAAVVGPVYVAMGEKIKAEALTVAGYLAEGVKPQYSQVLIQGIRHENSMKQASEFLTQAQINNEFSSQILLQMYEQIGDIDAYFQLAEQLANTYQYNPLTSYRINAKEVRQHPQFSSLMSKIGLVEYWQTIEIPQFCLASKVIICQ